MANITITISDEEKRILEKRANKNYFSLKEQIEDIIRRSCISQKNKSSTKEPKIDDKLISIFSKSNKGRKTKKN